MKRLPWVLILAMLNVPALAQTPSSSKKAAPRKRVVTLETVLSCSDDSLMDEVFKTDSFTARVELDAGLMQSMMMTKMREDPDTMALLAKGFVTIKIGESSLTIMPTDYHGDAIEVSKLPFCRNSPKARYEEFSDKDSIHSRPHLVEIDGEGWLLNPNEIFAHADQFNFESGVFINSSSVFFTAKKGRVSIQFICKPEGLKFYRALYFPRS